MATLYRALALGGSLALGLLGSGPVRAQADVPVPPGIVAQSEPDTADDPQSAAGLLVRIDRLEGRLRALTGQIEELQFQNKRLEDALRKMQADVDFRFQDLSRGGGAAPAPAPGARPAPLKRGDAEPALTAPTPLPGRPVPLKRGDAEPTGSTPAPAIAAVPPATPATPAIIAAPEGAPAAPAVPAPQRQARRTGDAFDPAVDPAAPGAPRPLGSTPPSAPIGGRADGGTPVVVGSPGEALATPPHAPLDLTPGAQKAPGTVTPAPAPLPGGDTAARAPAAPGAVASLVPGGTRGEFDGTLALYKAGQYDAAVTGFESFVQKYPRDRLVADATYFLGESYARLGRHREAAEQFLKVSTDYARSSRAPDALLRLGVALNALGAKDQACATYQEVDRKYPAASPDLRGSVEREIKRAHC